MHSKQVRVEFIYGLFIEIGKEYDIINRGRTKSIFPGIPEDITTAFRYTDTDLYFFRESIVLVMNLQEK